MHEITVGIQFAGDHLERQKDLRSTLSINHFEPAISNVCQAGCLDTNRREAEV